MFELSTAYVGATEQRQRIAVCIGSCRARAVPSLHQPLQLGQQPLYHALFTLWPLLK